MRDLPRIAAKLYGEPWMMRSDIYGSMLGQFEAARRGERLDADDQVGPVFYGVPAHPQVQVVRDVAVISVSGIIGKHLSSMEMECGGFCLANFGRQLKNVEEDENIRTVVIDFKTPGGVSIGVETAALQIRALAESGKRVIGYTDYDCCSAGYWLAAACDEFLAERSAIIGSISTYCAGVDSSKAWENEGYELVLSRTGDKKAMNMPGKAWTDDEKNHLEEKTKLVDEKFKSFVSARRGLTDDLMQGQTWAAADAPRELVDGLADSLDDVVAAAVGW